MTHPGVRPRRRLVGVALAVVAAVGLGTASAAQLGVNASTIAAGSATVGDCQDGAPVRVQLISGWSTTPNPDAFTTTGVVVHGVAAACNGKALRVTLVDGSGNALAEATLASISGAPGAQTGLTFTRAPAVGAFLLTSSVDEAKIVIHG